MNAAFTVDIFTPEAAALQTEATYLSVQAPDGGFGLMRGHLPCVIALVAGEIVLTLPDGGKKTCRCSDGFLEMRDNRAEIFVNTCEEVR